MPFDFKKEYREFYLPGGEPELIEVPPMRYAAVRGAGDPNEEGGAYKQAIEALYAVSYTLKMSPRAGREIEGFFEYVVPPLEGFWWQDGVRGFDLAHKEAFRWISVIRLPDFIAQADFDWAVREASRKKKEDFSRVEFFSCEEGLCVQCMHVGPYDDEPATVERMHLRAAQLGCEPDFGSGRLHHEIYLSDARRVAPERRRTVIRHPVRRL